MSKKTTNKIAYFVFIALLVVLGACTPSGASSESRSKTFFVDSQLVDCEGVAPQQCMLVRTDPNSDWEYFYDVIAGFEYEEGYTYEIEVNEFDVIDPPADGSSLRYELVEVVSKEMVATTVTDVYVDVLDIILMESFPVQVSVQVRGHLADGCVVLDGISVERLDDTFALRTHAHREGETVCTEALVPFDEAVVLDVLNLPAGTYTVTLDEHVSEFTLEVDNVGDAPLSQSESDVAITLERTACFGTCPVYTLTIYRDGRVVYNGLDFVEVTGEQTVQIDPKQVQELMDFMVNSGYLDLNDAYTDYNITDLPYATTSLTVNGSVKQIEHYYGDESAPFVLTQIERRIDMLVDSAQWTGAPAETNEAVFGSVMVRGEESEIVLPAGATLTVKLEDVSLADAPSMVISEKTYDNPSLPTFYDLVFDILEIDAQAMYIVSAQVTDSEGNLLYVTDTAYNALTFGSGQWVDIELVAVE